MSEVVRVEAGCKVTVNEDGQVVLSLEAGITGEEKIATEKVLLRAVSLKFAKQIAEAQGFRLVPAEEKP